MPAKQTTLSEVNRTVSVAPLVLLSVVDHYNRTVKNTNKRCVGIILGENDPSSDLIRATNSFAVPFEEDDKNSSVFFLDHNYIDTMSEMFKKINAKEKVIGWYHSGPKLKSNDLQINDLFKKYIQEPVLLIINVNHDDKSSGLPTDAYLSVQEIKKDGTETEKTFVHVPSTIEAEEPEEIGVEHLLRDIRDQAQGLLSVKIANQLKSLRGLNERLKNIIVYLNKVLNDQLPINHLILGKLQNVFNLLPNLISTNDLESIVSKNQATELNSSADNKNAATSKYELRDAEGNLQITEFSDLNKALQIKTNDNLMIVYVSSLINSIISFNDLIENKIENKNRLLKSTETEDDAAADKEKNKENGGDKEKTSSEGENSKEKGKGNESKAKK